MYIIVLPIEPRALNISEPKSFRQILLHNIVTHMGLKSLDLRDVVGIFKV